MRVTQHPQPASMPVGRKACACVISVVGRLRGGVEHLSRVGVNVPGALVRISGVGLPFTMTPWLGMEAEGEAAPGERIPPAVDLAAVLGVNRNTVLRALRILRDEGTVDFTRGRGVRVTGTSQRSAVIVKARNLAVGLVVQRGASALRARRRGPCRIRGEPRFRLLARCGVRNPIRRVPGEPSPNHSDQLVEMCGGWGLCRSRRCGQLELHRVTPHVTRAWVKRLGRGGSRSTRRSLCSRSTRLMLDSRRA
jgi:hypothetical protein